MAYAIEEMIEKSHQVDGVLNDPVTYYDVAGILINAGALDDQYSSAAGRER
jgi:hypothetical protein